MNRGNDPMPTTTWPEYEYQLGVGAYGGVDDRYKLRRRKNPIGFSTEPLRQRRPRKRK